MLDETNGARISIDDDTLVARVRAGDREAYAELVRRHAPMAFRTAALLGAGSDAEDVVQEALVKAYRSLGSFRAGRPFRPWLLRIVANEAHNRHRTSSRRAAREQGPAAVLPDAPADPAQSVVERERDRRLLDAVNALPVGQRRAVTCRYLLELDEVESAAVLGVPRGTVKSRLSRGLARLRTTLEEESGGTVATRPVEPGRSHD